MTVSAPCMASTIQCGFEVFSNQAGQVFYTEITFERSIIIDQFVKIDFKTNFIIEPEDSYDIQMVAYLIDLCSFMNYLHSYFRTNETSYSNVEFNKFILQNYSSSGAAGLFLNGIGNDKLTAMFNLYDLSLRISMSYSWRNKGIF